MGRESSGLGHDDGAATGQTDAQLEQLRALMARLHRAANQVTIGVSVQSAASTLARKVAKFDPSGDGPADRATLADLERQAVALLNRANRERRENAKRGVTGAAGMIVGSA